MAITAKDCATLMMGIYAYSGVAPIAWDHLDPGTDDGVCYGIKVIDGTPVVALRGSVTLEDWIRDFDCVADPFNDTGARGLGPVHPGFLLGIPKVLAEIELLFDLKKSVITGHSLGAGRACVLTGLMVTTRQPPLARIVFGEPKPGFAPLGKLIAGIPAMSYCAGDARGHDLVTDLPFSFPPEEYVHSVALTPLKVSPTPSDVWGMFSYHHMQGYFEALK